MNYGEGDSGATPRVVPTMTAAIYLGEVVFSIAVATVLLAASSFKSCTAILLFCCGVWTWTLAEYITHRFVLHAIAPLRHGLHHARPQDAVDKIFWQILARFRCCLPSGWRRRSGRRSPHIRMVFCLSTIASITIPLFSHLPCLNITSIITSLRAETSV